jgi:hypothetical protein
VAATGPRPNCFYFLDFMLHLGASLNEYHAATGDAETVRNLLPSLRRMHDYVQTFLDADGWLDNALHGKENIAMVFFDWSTRIHRNGRTTILNALYTEYLGHIADLLSLGNDSSDQELVSSLRTEAARLRKEAAGVFFDADRGVFSDAARGREGADVISQQANFAALAAGWELPVAADELLRRVCDDGDYPRPYGPSFYLFAFAGMAAAGAHRRLLDWIEDFWGAMLDRGATTWWEVFDMSTPRWSYPHPFLGNTPTYERDWIPVSHCHGWSGVPGYAIPRYLLGIDLLKIHKGEIHLDRSVPALFPAVHFRTQTVLGPLELKFRNENGKYAVEVVASPCAVIA